VEIEATDATEGDGAHVVCPYQDVHGAESREIAKAWLVYPTATTPYEQVIPADHGIPVEAKQAREAGPKRPLAAIQPKSVRVDGPCWGRLELGGTVVAGGGRLMSSGDVRFRNTAEHASCSVAMAARGAVQPPKERAP